MIESHCMHFELLFINDEIILSTMLPFFSGYTCMFPTVPKFEVILMMECAAAASPMPLCAGFRRTLNPVAQRHDRLSLLGRRKQSGKPSPLFWACSKIGQNHFKEHTWKLALFLMAGERNRAGMRKISFFQGPSHYLLRTLLNQV